MATPAKAKAAAKAVAQVDAAQAVGAAAPADAPLAAVDLYPAVDASVANPAEVEMARDGQTTLVRNNASVALMQALGWQLT